MQQAGLICENHLGALAFGSVTWQGNCHEKLPHRGKDAAGADHVSVERGNLVETGEMSAIAEAITERLLAWNPAGVAVTCQPIPDLQAPLLGDEGQAIARAVPTRRNEFIAGRTAARLSLRKLGLADCEILRGPDRDPQWPPGVVGTISHTVDLCIAMTAHQSSHWALGVDLEADVTLSDDLANLVMSAEEQASMAAPPIHYFAIKEAVFKAYFPATSAFLEFGDVELELAPERGTFRAHISAERPEPPWGKRIVTGHYAVIGGNVLSLAAVTT